MKYITYRLCCLCVGAKPKLHQLDRLKVGDKHKKIIEKVGVNWERLALRLEFDHCVIATIKENFSGRDRRIERCCQDMLCRWLDGEACQPVTWGRLVQALREIEMGILAEEVDKLLLH